MTLPPPAPPVISSHTPSLGSALRAGMKTPGADIEELMPLTSKDDASDNLDMVCCDADRSGSKGGCQQESDILAVRAIVSTSSTLRIVEIKFISTP